MVAEKHLRSLGLESWSLDETSAAVQEAPTDERYGEDPSKDLHEEDAEMMHASNDMTGEALEPEEVKKARKEELVYFKAMKVYCKVPLEECCKETGKKPIGVRCWT